MKDKENQIEEMAIKLKKMIKEVIHDIEDYSWKDIAKELYKIILSKDSVVLSKEELAKRDYEFRQIGYDECLRDNPKKDKYIKILERKIDQLNAKLDQASKEMAEKFYDKVMSYIGTNQKFWIVDDEQITIIDVDKLFDFVMGTAKQFGVEIKE